MSEKQSPYITRPDDLHALLKEVIDTAQHMRCAAARIDRLLDDVQGHAHDLRIDVTTYQRRDDET